MEANIQMKEIDLINIIKTRISFLETNEIFDEEEYRNVNKGEITAYKEILKDIGENTVGKFIAKYVSKAKELNVRIEDKLFADNEECEFLSGYNNAIIFVLGLIDPTYEYML